MVNNNEGIPNTINTGEETLSPNTQIILGTDSDTDQEETDPNGYQPLSSNADDYNDYANDSEGSDNETVNNQECSESIPSITSAEGDLLKELWSSTYTSVDINMDKQKVEEVKQAMINITLPSSSIPEWANNIPEVQWKQHLVSRLSNLQKHSCT